MKIKTKQLQVTEGKLIQGTSTGTSETVYTFPEADGLDGQVLTTDGNGALSFSTVSGGGGSGSSISDSDGDTKIQVEESSDEDKIRFDTAGTERMIITDDGKIGIGTSTPARKLDIDGDLVVRGGDIHGNTTGNPAISVSPSSDVQINQSLFVVGTTTLNSVEYTWPNSDGSNGQVLTTNGSGVLDFTTVSGGGGGSPFSENLLPNASDTYDLGSTTKEWRDLYLSDSSVIHFGADQDTLLKHDPDQGLTIDLSPDQAGKPFLTLKTKSSSMAAGTALRFIGETTSPGVGDIIGTIQAIATDYENVGGTLVNNTHNYTEIRNKIKGMMHGSEAGSMHFYVATNGQVVGSSTTEALVLEGNTSTSTTSTIVNGTLKIGTEFAFPTTDGTANQVLETDGSGNVSWATVSGGGGGGSRPTIATITASDFSGSPSTYAIPDQGSSVMELVCLVNATGGVSRTIKLPSAGSDDIGLKIQVKRIGSDPVSVSPASNDYIDGTQDNSLALTNVNSNLTFICTSSDNWHIV